MKRTLKSSIERQMFTTCLLCDELYMITLRLRISGDTIWADTANKVQAAVSFSVLQQLGTHAWDEKVH